MAGVTKLPFGQRPLMLYNGEVSCQTLTGKISIVRLNTHNFHDDQELSEEEVCLCEWGVVCKLFNPFWKFFNFLRSRAGWSLVLSGSHVLLVTVRVPSILSILFFIFLYHDLYFFTFYFSVWM